MDKPIPCPFCGKSYIDMYQTGYDKKYFEKCTSCGATGGYAGTKEEAAELWNKRKSIGFVGFNFPSWEEVKTYDDTKFMDIQIGKMTTCRMLIIPYSKRISLEFEDLLLSDELNEINYKRFCIAANAKKRELAEQIGAAR